MTKKHRARTKAAAPGGKGRVITTKMSESALRRATKVNAYGKVDPTTGKKARVWR